MKMLGAVLTMLVLGGCSKQATPARDTGVDGADAPSFDVRVDVRADASDDADGSTGPDGPVQIETTSGPVGGEREDGRSVFLGIPYAQPPVGERRWAPPADLIWTTPFDATSFGSRCPQPNIAFTSLVGDEDCLTLNVWGYDEGANKPVMVWFHGGSFLQGSATEKTYHGQDLTLHDVVVVTANYRLGALGFLAHPSLPGRNFGLQDQLAVLDWVSANARALGGDPGNVTVFGESAGGIAACLMVAGGHGEGRFDRAISQSGPCTGLLPLPDVAAAEAQGDALAAAVSCDQAADVVACLRGLPQNDIVDALGFRLGVIFGDGAAWVPVRDDVLVPIDVEVALATAATPMLMGSNADEGSLAIIAANQGIIEIDYTTATEQMFGTRADVIRAQYPRAGYPDDVEAVAAILGDRFVCGTRRVARLRANAGHAVWLYHFTHSFVTPIGDLGAVHGSELPFVFGTELTLVKLRDDEIPLSELMQRYWSRFAVTGDPNGGADVAWPPYSTAGDSHIVLDTEPSTAGQLRTSTCDFWDGVDDA